MIPRCCMTVVLELLALSGTLQAFAGPSSIKTPGEETKYRSYTQHEEVARFLDVISKASPSARRLIIGRTLETKDLPPVELRLCVITEEGIDDPKKLNRKKVTFLIFAAQHGNEQSGKEAALQLIRDLTIGELKPLLRKINVLIIPQSNPYGNFVNRRQNEQNLDLNRDHVKLEAPETRAIHAVFRAWMPEVTLDVHEKGDDYYRVSTGCVSNLNIGEKLQRYSREKVFPAISKKVEADGFTWHEYLVTDTAGSASAAGVPDTQTPRGGRDTLLRYSTTDLNDGRNALGIYETLSFIQEGASRHDLTSLEARTRWQYSGIRALLEYAANNGSEIRSMVRGLRSKLLRKAGAPQKGGVVHLRMQYVRDPKEPDITLKRFESTRAGNEPAATEPRVTTETIKNWYPKVDSQLTAPRAAGFLVPANRREVVKTLHDHGIRLDVIDKDKAFNVETYRIEQIEPSKDDYVAPMRIEVARQAARITAQKGDYYVSCRQPAANLIPSLLEPQSEYGLIRYRAYSLLPGKGETFAIWRVLKTR